MSNHETVDNLVKQIKRLEQMKETQDYLDSDGCFVADGALLTKGSTEIVHVASDVLALMDALLLKDGADFNMDNVALLEKAGYKFKVGEEAMPGYYYFTVKASNFTMKSC